MLTPPLKDAIDKYFENHSLEISQTPARIAGVTLVGIMVDPAIKPFINDRNRSEASSYIVRKMKGTMM